MDESGGRDRVSDKAIILKITLRQESRKEAAIKGNTSECKLYRVSSRDTELDLSRTPQAAKGAGFQHFSNPRKADER